MAVFATLAAVVAAIVFTGNATTSDPVAVPVEEPVEPSPTPQPEATETIPAPTPGPESLGPLEVVDRGEAGTGWPLGTHTLDGDTYVFASTAAVWGAIPQDGAEFRAWRSTDLEAWTPVPQRLPAGLAVQAVTTSDTGFTAVAGRVDGGVQVLTSTDGGTWVEAGGPIATEADVVATGIASSRGVTLLATQQKRPDLRSLLRERLGSLPPQVQIDWGGPPLEIYVRAPAGLLLAVYDADDLGLPEDEAASFFTINQQPPTTSIWRLGPDDAVTETTREDLWFAHLKASDQGFFIFGAGWRSGEIAEVSSDGISWARLDIGFNQLASNGDRLVATRHDQVLHTSTNGADWTRVPIPAQNEAGGLHQPTVSADATAALMWSFESPTQRDEPERILLKDGFEFRVPMFGQRLSITNADGISHRIPLWGPGEVDPGLSFDAATGTVGFADPGGGAARVTLTLQELGLLQPPEDVFGPGTILMATGDHHGFHMTPLNHVLGDRTNVSLIQAVGRRILIVATDYDIIGSRPFGAPTAPPTIRLLTMDLPLEGE